MKLVQFDLSVALLTCTSYYLFFCTFYSAEFLVIYSFVLCVCLDVKGLFDQQLIEKLQDKVHASLLEYNNNFHPGEPNRFGNILLRLPELRSIGTKSLERLFMLSLTGQINASDSLSELLHSTKR